MTSSDQPLATAHGLAAYHARRAYFYSALAVLLSAPPQGQLLASARHLLRPSTPTGQLLSSVLTADGSEAAATEHQRLFSNAAPLVRLGCRDPGAPSRDLIAVRGMIGPDIADELRALAMMANRTARAIEMGDIADAVHYSELQARFLLRHAGRCASALIADLETVGAPFYRAVGQSLGAQMTEDRRELGDDSRDSV